LTVALVGIDLKEYQNLDTEINHVGVFHIGAMDWLPNIEGVEWLINKVWIPGIQPVKNDLKLFLAGRNMPEKFFSLNRPTIVNDGEVADAKKYMASKTIMLVPLLSGGGMRVKIAEGMASGKTIISTRIGAEGIPYTENKNIVIADTVEEFTKAILHCVQEKSFCKNIAENARILAGECFDNEKIGLNLIEFYLKLLKSTQPVTKEFKAN
jgi:glycosyltransferase involved in cell wall biosynthesis